MSPRFELRGKTAVVVTMHGKKPVIAAELEATGLSFLKSPAVDTDRFGTFTRDIERRGSQVEAMIAKAQAGLTAAPAADFAVASEGAFGPHPEIPFLPAGLELVGLLDRRTRKLVVGRHFTINTNFAQCEARSLEEVHGFASRIGFPEHAMVIMKTMDGPIVGKGISAPDALESIAGSLIGRHGAVWLEADMRASFNPTRLRAIGLAGKDLARRLDARCPNCGFPGWVATTRGGRPCSWCDAPTLEPWLEQFACEGCGNARSRYVEPGRKADPGNCSACNP